MAQKATLGALLAALILLAPAAHPQAANPLKTRNVVLVVSDGVRWQEVFTGADPTLLNEKNGGIWGKEAQDLRREFWRADVNERRKALFPFLWTTVAAHGQIFVGWATRPKAAWRVTQRTGNFSSPSRL